MAFVKLALFAALVAVCSGGPDWTKCKPNAAHLAVVTDCIKTELGKTAATKEELKALHTTSTEDDMMKVAVCTMKKKGVLNDKNEYVEAKAIECANEMETTPEIKAKIVEGIKTCGQSLDHKLKADQLTIFKCSKDLMKKECQ